MSEYYEVPRQRDWLLVSEQFDTHQGEGPTCGMPAHFLRLGACNQACWFCDTPYTWAFDKRHAEKHGEKKQYDPQVELKRMRIHDLADHFIAAPANRLVVSGGEPMLQSEGIGQLFDEICERLSGHRDSPHFEIETAGTIPPVHLSGTRNLRFNVSLKLASSGNPLEVRRVPDAIIGLRKADSIFKFVIGADTLSADIDEIHDLIDQFALPASRIWLMPQGRSPEEIIAGLQQINSIALKYGWSITGRQHVLIYGDKRGH